MSKRKHIGYKTRCASLILQLGHIPYDDAKQMTEDQIISLYHVDHNMLHSSEHEDRDKFWNLTHTLIAAHRTKTKADAKIIAKSKRIRERVNIRAALDESLRLSRELLAAELLNSADSPLRTGLGGQRQKAEDVSAAAIRPARTLQSRGFDKTKTKGFDGKVRDRKP